MASLTLKGDEYSIKYDEEMEGDKTQKALDDKMWIVIRNTSFTENEGYRLRDGDVIKLGKVIFKVKEIKVDQKSKIKQDKKINKAASSNNNNLIKDRTIPDIRNNNQSSNRQGIEFAPEMLNNAQGPGNSNNLIQNNKNNSTNNNHDKNLSLNHKNQSGNNLKSENLGEIPKGKRRKKIIPQCRICLMEDNDADNPLINPCSCIGSVRFIHVDCIRKWLKSKITTKMFNFLIVHSFKNLECELCKKTFPERIKFKDEIINIYEMQKPENNYIMLESISREKRENRYLYIIHLKDKQSIKLGRANDSDVRMTDISVSRNHASLKLYNGYLYLQDNASKFGTLVNLQRNLIVIPQRQLALQSGKLYLLLNLKKTCFASFRCYKNKTLMQQDYNDYLEAQVVLSSKPEDKYELESMAGTIKNATSKKNEDEDNKIDNIDIFKEELSPGTFDEVAEMELREVSRENLFSSVNIKNIEHLRNQANLTDISIHRYVNTENINNLNLNAEHDLNPNLNNNNINNNNVLTTAYFNLNTSNQFNNNNPNYAFAVNLRKNQTDSNINNSITNKSNLYTNTNNNMIRESSNCGFLENEERLLLRGKTEETPKMKKRIQMKTFKRNDLRLDSNNNCNSQNNSNNNNLEFEADKIFIVSSNTNKNKKASFNGPINYNYLGTADSLVSPKHARINIPNSTHHFSKKVKEPRGKTKKDFSGAKDKKYKSEIISENEKSQMLSQNNISKISREGLLLNNSNNCLFEEKRNFGSTKNISHWDKTDIELADMRNININNGEFLNGNESNHFGNQNDNGYAVFEDNMYRNSPPCDKVGKLNEFRREFKNRKESDLEPKDLKKYLFMKGNSIGVIDGREKNKHFSSNDSTNNKHLNKRFNQNQKIFGADLSEDFKIKTNETKGVQKEKIVEVLNLDNHEKAKNIGVDRSSANNLDIAKQQYNSVNLRENLSNNIKIGNKVSFSQNFADQQILEFINDGNKSREVEKANVIRSKTMDMLDNIFGSNDNNNNLNSGENNNEYNNDYCSNNRQNFKANLSLNSAQKKTKKIFIENSAEKLRHSVTEMENSERALDENGDIKLKSERDALIRDEKNNIRSLDFENIENANDIFNFVKKERNNIVIRNHVPTDDLIKQAIRSSNSLENNFVIKNDDFNNFKSEKQLNLIENEGNLIDFREKQPIKSQGNKNQIQSAPKEPNGRLISKLNENAKFKTIENPNETNNEVLVTSENEINKSQFVLGRENANDFRAQDSQRDKVNSIFGENLNATVNVDNKENDVLQETKINNIVVDRELSNKKTKKEFFECESDDPKNKLDNLNSENFNHNNNHFNSIHNFDENNFIFEDKDSNRSINVTNNNNLPKNESFLKSNSKQNLKAFENKEKTDIMLESPKFNSNRIIINGTNNAENLSLDKSGSNKKNPPKASSTLTIDILKPNPKKYEKLNTEENKNEVSIYEKSKKPEFDLVTIETDYNRDEKTNQNNFNFGSESVRNSNLFTEKHLTSQLNLENRNHVGNENYEVEMIPSVGDAFGDNSNNPSTKNILALNDSESNNDVESLLLKNKNNSINKNCLLVNNSENNNTNENQPSAAAANADVNTEYFNTNDINNFNFDTHLNTNHEIINNNVFIVNPSLNQENNFNYNTIASSRETELNKVLNEYDVNNTTHDNNLVINNPVSETVNKENSFQKINFDLNKAGDVNVNPNSNNTQTENEVAIESKSEELNNKVIIEEKKSS